MTGDRSSTDGSSISPTTPSPSSRRSRPGSSRSSSSGSGLSRRALQDLASRHGIFPQKSLGQNFLADSNLARAIARDAGAGPGERVLEVGAGLGSLTVALAEAGAEVLAVELDRALLPALEEVVAGLERVRVVRQDAMRVDWVALLGEGGWRMASNLPYNVAVPVVMGLLERAPGVDPMLVMVQREVGERLAAGPGEEQFGAVSLRVAWWASASVVRRVPPSVFWPAPRVESVIVRLERHGPPVDAPREAVFGLIEAGFAQRRKTMANALVRLGNERSLSERALVQIGLDPRVRAEEMGLDDFGRLVGALR